ncbi:MAG: DUF4388 domain-containing protein [Planctomycetota bacterium]
MTDSETITGSEPVNPREPKVLVISRNHKIMRAIVDALHQRGLGAVPVSSTRAAIQMLDYEGLVSVIMDISHLDFETATMFGSVSDHLIHRSLPSCAIVPDDLAPEELALISKAIPAMVPIKGDPENAAVRAARNVQIQTKRTTMIRNRRGPKTLELKVLFYPLPEVMQFLEQRKADGMLELVDEQHAGLIYYKSGMIVHAIVDNELDGMDAIFLMLQFRDGTLHFYNDTPPPRQTIDRGSTMILLDALRRKDEAQSMLDEALKRREERAKSSSYHKAGGVVRIRLPNT